MLDEILLVELAEAEELAEILAPVAKDPAGLVNDALLPGVGKDGVQVADDRLAPAAVADEVAKVGDAQSYPIAEAQRQNAGGKRQQFEEQVTNEIFHAAIPGVIS